MASPLVSGWLHATVPVYNPQGASGTGFLVLREVVPGQGRIFLVTNKQVICADPQHVCQHRISSVTSTLRSQMADPARFLERFH
jgi:hypothetical protein